MIKQITIILLISIAIAACEQHNPKSIVDASTLTFIIPDTNDIPKDDFGNLVRYGRELMLNTAHYIGPDGINGQHLGNKMNCTNCHQDAGTKPYAFNLMRAHERYPQYRPREDRVLSLMDRVNNCIERPHNGIALPLQSKEMTAFLSYFKWINTYVNRLDSFAGEKNLPIQLPDRAADYLKGEQLYAMHCVQCHQIDGGGLWNADSSGYIYPPVWGKYAYKPGSSMHRITTMAGWLKANMPHLQATYDKPILTDEEALDIAAFINNDSLHYRPFVASFDYPNPMTKPIDYGRGPFADTFSEAQHKYGPYQPIIDYWTSKGWKPVR
jgi:thiosulfate dehydrogenase